MQADTISSCIGRLSACKKVAEHCRNGTKSAPLHAGRAHPRGGAPVNRVWGPVPVKRVCI